MGGNSNEFVIPEDGNTSPEQIWVYMYSFRVKKGHHMFVTLRLEYGQGP